MKSDENITQPDGFLEENLEELYEMAPCGYISTTPEGWIVRANRTFAGWIGYQQKELSSGIRITDLLTVGSRIFYETHLALLLRLHPSVDEIAVDMVCKDGRILPTLINARQKRNAGDEPQMNRLTVFDATERRAYERELLAARKRAELSARELGVINEELARSNAALLKTNEDLAQFAYAASHDLQEPLRTMTAYSQLLNRRYKGQLDGDADTFLGYIQEGSTRMKALIDGLLSFSRAQGSDLVLRPTEMKLTLELALANLRSAINESGAVVTYDDLPTMYMDAASMVQVFQNLVGNAIKYRKSGEHPRVHIAAEKNGSADWLISVEDHGIGFDASYAEHIFGIFKRLHGREIPGSGIGLAICKKIIESQDGKIWALSTAGAGSKFCFTIPDRS